MTEQHDEREQQDLRGEREQQGPRVDRERRGARNRLEVVDGRRLVSELSIGERQVEGPLAVFPILMNGNGGGREADHREAGGSGGSVAGGEGAARRSRTPYYITLRQALAEGRAQITEVSEGGSVPELRVVNKGDARVLVLDGEELRGAKQNRVLSTTILIDKHTALTVPVSCTEAGRWSYASREFAESQIVAERSVRFSMKASVHEALACGMPLRADQGRVWHEVDLLHARQGTHSRTSAMRDSYESKRLDLDRLIAAFPLREGQSGLLVLHGSRVVGFDLVSRPGAYSELHDKLLRSYAFEALVRGGEPGDRSVADAFLKRIAGLSGQRFKSPGLGWDVRFEGDGVLGSALTYRGFVVHAAFFDVGGAGRSVETSDGGPGGAGSGRTRQQPDWRIADARERARRRQGR
jgi:hypothetical protein